MRARILAIIGILLLSSCVPWKGKAVNPDPNHTHADFAVWIEDMQVNFARPQFMSGVSTDETSHDEEGEYLHKYFHLHDGNGHVMHSHKPGQTVADFFASLGMELTKNCFRLDHDHADCTGKAGTLRMFVNGREVPVNPKYSFQDLDKILIIFTSNEANVQAALGKMTSDACRYSQTCPERGKPPAENCVADPEVPCVEP